MDTEAVRDRYRPVEIRVLFIGESPPAGGTFFYAANSLLYFATVNAFESGVPDLLERPKFLDAFKALGCFLDDLCVAPVNQLGKAQRQAEREAGEEDLAARMRESQPEAVVIVMKGIAVNVSSAMSDGSVVVKSKRAFSFPSRPEHKESYITELSAHLRELGKQGILRRE